MADKPKSEIADRIGQLVAEEMQAAMLERGGATVGLLESIDTSLTDMVDALEKNTGGKQFMQGLIDALKGMQSKPQPAPIVNVSAPPMTMPAPVVHIQSAADVVFDVKFDYGPNGRLMGLKVVRGTK